MTTVVGMGMSPWNEKWAPVRVTSKYAEAYPALVGRMTLDGVLDPAASNAEVVREQTRGFELALRRSLFR